MYVFGETPSVHRAIQGLTDISCNYCNSSVPWHDDSMCPMKQQCCVAPFGVSLTGSILEFEADFIHPGNSISRMICWCKI